ncbi:hypothetical protein J6590_004489 [Homalodisca vitripennis]|nr:hypothetical protein J6590_004489 [Homalodisca vitripennis]
MTRERKLQSQLQCGFISVCAACRTDARATAPPTTAAGAAPLLNRNIATRCLSHLESNISLHYNLQVGGRMWLNLSLSFPTHHQPVTTYGTKHLLYDYTITFFKLPHPASSDHASTTSYGVCGNCSRQMTRAECSSIMATMHAVCLGRFCHHAGRCTSPVRGSSLDLDPSVTSVHRLLRFSDNLKSMLLLITG